MFEQTTTKPSLVRMLFDEHKFLLLEHPLLTRAEAAQLLKCSKPTIDNLIKTGQLMAIRTTKRWVRIPRQSILELLAHQIESGESSTGRQQE